MRRARGLGAVLAFSVACGCGSSGSSGGSPDGGAGQGGSSGLGGAGGGGGVAGAAAAGGGSGVGGSGVGGSSGGGGGTGGSTVSGTVSIVNPGSGTSTSVIVAPSSFNPDAPSLVAPVGPKATGVTGSWSIPNVPDGQYTVLVAWENDGLVLDPDPAVGGAKLVVIDVAGADVDAGSFKVTGALEVVSPNDGAQATLPLTFKWKDASGEDHYELRVYDQSGSVVHTNLAIPAVSGSPEVVAPYTGGALTSGATYQFRAVAVTAGGAPMTRTENLRGVFIAP